MKRQTMKSRGCLPASVVEMCVKKFAGTFILYGSLIVSVLATVDRPRDNGDVYVINDDDLDVSARDDVVMSTSAPQDQSEVNMEAVMKICNASFITPESYIVEFNNTASLPDEKDKTSMCYIRCFLEKTSMLKNWKLNADFVRKHMWPATGDSVEVCENKSVNETNSCVRAYDIAKCLMIRALTDARNKPMV